MSTAADVSIRSDGNQQHLQTVNDPNDIEEDFDDMMDQLLERDGPAVGGGESGGSAASAPVAAAAIVAHIIATDDSMAEDVDDTQHDSQVRNRQQNLSNSHVLLKFKKGSFLWNNLSLQQCTKLYSDHT